MIKAVIMDCFGVLYIPKSDYIYQSILANPIQHHDEIRDLVAQNEYGLIDDAALFEGISQLIGMPVQEVRRHLVGGFVRNTELVDYIQGLRPGRKVALLSNLGHSSVVQYFTAEERTQLFDVAVISGEVGMIKPHSEIFEYTCRQLGVDVSEAVMVDDSRANCAGALEAGLQAVHFESTVQTKRALDGLLAVE